MHSIHKAFTMLMLLSQGVFFAQVSSDCATAVPICNNTPVNGGAIGFGNDDFNGASTSGCLEQTLSGAIESNSVWYRFRTSAAGQLGFNIGHDPAEDWDFALYQSDDCNDLGEPIRCNFFDNSDQNAFIGVGEDPSGQSDTVQYEDWLQVAPGQEYYLLLNNFSNDNSGFSIQFSGQIFADFPYTALDCSIVSNLLGPPIAACSNDIVTLDATSAGAIAYSWYQDTGSGFTEIIGETNPNLEVVDNATYRVRVITSTNTLTSDVQVAFTEAPTTLPTSDITFCHTPDGVVDLSQKDMEVLGTQLHAMFLVSYHTSQADAQSGINPLNKAYPILPGNQTIFIRVTAIQNAQCYDATESFVLYALETPNLNLETEVTLCHEGEAITIGASIPNAMYAYLWSTGETTASIAVEQEGEYTLTATHSLGTESCSTTQTVVVAASAEPRITEIQVDDLQANNRVEVLTDVIGEFEYRLDGGTFQSSPVFSNVLPGTHTLVMRDIHGCNELMEEIVVVGFLNHFSPNGDGSNEDWHIDGLEFLEDPVVTIFDRYGKLLQQLTTSEEGWDGTYNGQAAPATDYWFKLSYRDATGNRVYARYIQNHFSLRR
ncbi:MAG: T9SS type B sorting domain-containing protein [Bacteroidota bacterium]